MLCLPAIRAKISIHHREESDKGNFLMAEEVNGSGHPQSRNIRGLGDYNGS